MAQIYSASSGKSKLTNRKSAKSRPQLSMFRSSIIALTAAIAGVAAAVPLTLAVMMPVVRQEIAADTASLGSRSVQLRTAADTLDCTQPAPVSSSSSGGQVLGSSTVQQPLSNSGGSTTTITYVKKLVSGAFTANGTITNTGPGSHNSITANQTATTTITNNNDLSVNNSNYQQSSSGSAEVEANTTGGAATTGDASNTNNSSFNFSVSN